MLASLSCDENDYKSKTIKLIKIKKVGFNPTFLDWVFSSCVGANLGLVGWEILSN